MTPQKRKYGHRHLYIMLTTLVFKNIKLLYALINYLEIITKFALKSYKVEFMKDLNRLKVVLAEKKRTNKWLAEQLGKNVTTVSKWCTNTSQPDLQTLDKIAELLECDTRVLITSKIATEL